LRGYLKYGQKRYESVIEHADGRLRRRDLLSLGNQPSQSKLIPNYHGE